MNPIRRSILCTSMVFFSILPCLAQKEAGFQSACRAVIKAVAAKNLKALNALVHPVYGVYLVYRPGAMDSYQRFSKLENEYPYRLEDHPVQAADMNRYPLVYGKLPLYNCDNNTWNRKGFCTDTLKRYAPISEIVAFRKKYDEIEISKADLSAIRMIEKGSRKVVFTGRSGDGIVFYLYYSKGKWYLSIIDTVTTDCSA